MDKLGPFICEDRKPVENNIRVCLSTNKCFHKVNLYLKNILYTKNIILFKEKLTSVCKSLNSNVLCFQVPVVPDSLDSKRNYWKLDLSQITAKMVRRHFKGILELFPELSSKLETENMSRPSESCSALHSPEPAACGTVQIRCEVKFSSPFSIESLLKRDSPSAQASKSSPLSSVPVRAQQMPRPTLPRVGTKRSFSWDCEEPLLLQASAGSSPICSAGGSTLHGLNANRAAKTIKRMPVCTEPSFPAYRRISTTPHFTNPHSSYITYSVPTFTHDAHRFRL